MPMGLDDHTKERELSNVMIWEGNKKIQFEGLRPISNVALLMRRT